MTVAVLSDLLGVRRLDGRLLGSVQALEDLLVPLGSQPLHWLTDWGPGAVTGVQTVWGTGAAAIATLEKQLRERGDTDDFSHVVVHEATVRTGSTTLAFTAVPLKTWRHYHQLAQEHQSLVLMHDWTRSLLAWAKTRDWADGPLVAVMSDGVDVLIFRRQRLHAVERFRCFGDQQSSSWVQLGQRVLACMQAHTPERTAPTTSADEQAPTGTCLLLLCAGSEKVLDSLLEGLGPNRPTEVWAEAPEALSSSAQAQLPCDTQRLVLADAMAAQPLQAVTNRAIDKLSWVAERWIGRIGVGAFLVSLSLAVAAQWTERGTHARRAEMSEAVLHSQRQLVQLQSAVAESEQLSAEQVALREWIEKRVNNQQVPDISWILDRVRTALPSAVVVDEIGLVVQNGDHLLTLVGQVRPIEDSLRVEADFAKSLREVGFDVRQRDVLLRNGQPKFKLSLTRSGS